MDIWCVLKVDQGLKGFNEGLRSLDEPLGRVGQRFAPPLSSEPFPR